MFAEKLRENLSGRFTIAKVIYLYGRLLLMPKDKKFKSLKNKHKGERCFVVGLGPSLTLEDLNLLYSAGEICFSVNKIYRLFSETNWRPDYYFFSDPRGYTNETVRAVNDMESGGKTKVIYCKTSAKGMPSSAIYYRSNDIQSAIINSRAPWIRRRAKPCRFSANAEKYIYDGASCIHSIIQLAYYMGFSKLYLIGTDCGAVSGRDYCEHIHMGASQRGYIVEGNEMIEDYQSLFLDMQEKQIPLKIYNATRGGRLDVFPRISLEEVLGCK